MWQEFSRLEQRAELTTPTIRMIKYAIFYALAWVAVVSSYAKIYFLLESAVAFIAWKKKIFFDTKPRLLSQVDRE